ncbi:hypothetical protein P367_02835 [Comamonas thiooxydans]|nr:hypothetical protein P367_02835 [Comamonas thiooxydans]
MDMLLIAELVAPVIHRSQHEKHLNSLINKRIKLLYS